MTSMIVTPTIPSSGIRRYAMKFGVENPRCGNCQHFRHEHDGEFGEFECGTYCALRDPDMERHGDCREGGLCGLWTPEFWQTRFAEHIQRPTPGDVSDQLEVAVKDYQAALREAV